MATETVMNVHKVDFPDGTNGYDVNQLEYCCRELQSDLIGDGAAVILIDEGLCLRSNLPGPHRRLEYCYSCGAKITHTESQAEPKPIEEIKEPVSDPIP
jgi:hypothetical protein